MISKQEDGEARPDLIRAAQLRERLNGGENDQRILKELAAIERAAPNQPATQSRENVQRR